MYMLLFIIESYKLNPFTRELHAYPDRNGIVPILGVDGWVTLINRSNKFNGLNFSHSKEVAKMDNYHKPCPAWMECQIYLKGHNQPVSITEYFDEVYRPPFVSKKTGEVVPGPWQTHTKRMMRHKTMIQCARIALGYGNLYDVDDGERILESHRLDEEPKARASSSTARRRSSRSQKHEELKQKIETARDAVYTQPEAKKAGTGTKESEAKTAPGKPAKAPKESKTAKGSCMEADEFFAEAEGGKNG